MNKKIILFGMTFLLGINSIVFADSFEQLSISAEHDTHTVSISGRIEKVLNPIGIGISIIKKDAVVGDENAMDTIFAADNIITSNDGSFDCRFKIRSNSTDGWYKVYLANREKNINNSTDVYVAPQSVVLEALEALNKASADDYEECILKYCSESMPVLNISTETYLKDSETINPLLIVQRESIGGSFKSIAEFMDSYNDTNTVIKINNVTDAKELAGMINDLNEALKVDLSTEYVNVAEEVCRRIIDYRDDNGLYETVDDIRTQFNLNLPICAINNAGTRDIVNIAEKYNSVLKLNLSGNYKKLDSVNVMKALYKKDFKTVDEIRKAFDDRVSELISEMRRNESQASSGGGRGGGGGGGSSKAVNVSINPMVSAVTPNVVEDKTPEEAVDEVSFADIENHWAKDSILRLARKKILAGKSDKYFAPDDYITKEEFVKVLVVSFDLLDNKTEDSFADVPADDWSFRYVASAKQAGIVTGDENGLFGRGSYVSRQDMCVMLDRIINKGKKSKYIAASFSDNDAISEYARASVAALESKGIVKGMGDGRFEPMESCTRAQVAAIIDSILED